jgi:alpha-mannosidase
MADFGEHQFKYSLYPHAGSWNEETQREAYLLNDPIIVYRRIIDDKPSAMTKDPGSHLAHTRPGVWSQGVKVSSLVSASEPNVIIETVKRAEDGNGIILRLYESQRKRGPVQVKFGFTVESAWETNLLEEHESELSVENDSIQLNLRPYQIMTIRVKEKA